MDDGVLAAIKKEPTWRFLFITAALEDLWAVLQFSDNSRSSASFIYHLIVLMIVMLI